MNEANDVGMGAVDEPAAGSEILAPIEKVRHRLDIETRLRSLRGEYIARPSVIESTGRSTSHRVRLEDRESWTSLKRDSQGRLKIPKAGLRFSSRT